jgi:hypothetical protein
LFSLLTSVTNNTSYRVVFSPAISNRCCRLTTRVSGQRAHVETGDSRSQHLNDVLAGIAAIKLHPGPPSVHNVPPAALMPPICENHPRRGLALGPPKAPAYPILSRLSRLRLATLRLAAGCFCRPLRRAGGEAKMPLIFPIPSNVGMSPIKALVHLHGFAVRQPVTV